MNIMVPGLHRRGCGQTAPPPGGVWDLLCSVCSADHSPQIPGNVLFTQPRIKTLLCCPLQALIDYSSSVGHFYRAIKAIAVPHSELGGLCVCM